MESGYIRRVLVALLLAIGMALAARVPAAFSQAGAPPARRIPHTSNIEVVAYGYRGWLNSSTRVEAGAYVIHLESTGDEQPPFKDYVQLGGNDHEAQIMFREVPAPLPGERSYDYRLTVTYEGHYYRKPDSRFDEEVRFLDREFDQSRDTHLSSQEAGHQITWRVEIKSFDVPIP